MDVVVVVVVAFERGLIHPLFVLVLVVLVIVLVLPPPSSLLPPQLAACQILAVRKRW